MSVIFQRVSFCLPAVLFAFTVPAAFADPGAELAIAQRQFVPHSLELPAGKKVRLTVHNHDKLPAEFESYDLSREIVVPPGSSVQLYVGPLKPGEYSFFNDFDRSAKGTIIVKPAKQENQQ